MTDHKTGTREEWLAARLELLEAEKELTRRSDELARRRQELPWVRIDKEYRFETEEGSASLADLFRDERARIACYHGAQCRACAGLRPASFWRFVSALPSWKCSINGTVRFRTATTLKSTSSSWRSASAWPLPSPARSSRACSRPRTHVAASSSFPSRS